MPGTLRDDILAIPGIDDAHLDGDAMSPAGVRVRLSYGADPQHVGREVRRILALHGMRSQLTEVPDRVAPAEPPPPPPPPGTVVNLSDYENDVAESERDAPDLAFGEPQDEVSDAEDAVTPEAPAGEPTATEAVAAADDAEPESLVAEVSQLGDRDESPAADDTEPEASDAGEPELEGADEPDVTDDVAGHPPVADVAGLPALGNVAVIEGANGVTVTASTKLGKTKSRTAPPSPGGVDRAIVSAVSRLLAPEQDPPLLVEILDSDREDESILTVVLELEAGQHAVGSAIQAANRSWAVARATRAVLNAPE